MRLPSTILTFLTILACGNLLPAQESQLSSETLDKLDRLIQTFVDEDDVVGAELLVIKGGETILHEAYGWRDRESETAMASDSVFCVRSMTKPIIGTAILMLVEEGRIGLEDRVSRFLPGFVAEPTSEITIEQLLTHTSGMSRSRILAADLHAIDGIQAVASMGAGQELEFAPGSAFNYSDQGTDTLTAVIEVVTGIPADEFVQSRILDPLGMRSSACLMPEGHPLRTRGCSKYAGSSGAWNRFWDPSQAPLFPFFLGSQGLYSTVQDYARFMEFWKDRGMVGGERLLDAALMRKALAPGPHRPGFPADIPTLSIDYGYLMTLWTSDATGETVAFGHNGSDGTHAWVFPQQDAMVLYFTQSRGTSTGMRVGVVLAELFLDVAPPEVLTTPSLEQYLGYYWEHDDDSYRAVVRDGEDLALEIHGKGLVPLDYIGEDSWQLRPNPNEVLVFDRSEDGKVIGFHSGDHHEYRFTPSEELPSVDELATRIAAVHRLDLLESLGPMSFTGEIDMKNLNIKGTFESTYAWPGRFRNDAIVNGQFEYAAFDGKDSSYASSTATAFILEGLRADQQRMDNYFARFGDWHRWHPRMEVIQHLVRGGKEIYLVRAGDASAPAITYFVDAESGRVLGEDKVMLLEGMGMMGLRVRFDDFRDVSGMLLPYRTQVKLSNPMIGSIYSTVTSYELGVELPEGVFQLVD
ncbi:MAG: serine hydrolase domain-containing protein [Planctomycetota bacterium]|jgi:CubicO group peptidase (beta-lactamase class C family)